MSEIGAQERATAGEIAERVRRALLEAAAQGWEEAGVAGLCGEGAFEAAIGRMRSVDLGPVLEGATEPSRRPDGD